MLLVNTDPDDDYEIHRGDRIAQLVIQRVEAADFRGHRASGPPRCPARGRRFRAHRSLSMEPLPGIDAAFLAFENGPTRLHVAAVLVLDPPEGRRSLFSPSTRYAQIRRAVEQRLHLVPQLRQRAVRVPLGLHHPVWVDDPEFELDDHLRTGESPGPGRQP